MNHYMYEISDSDSDFVNFEVMRTETVQGEGRLVCDHFKFPRFLIFGSFFLTLLKRDFLSQQEQQKQYIKSDFQISFSLPIKFLIMRTLQHPPAHFPPGKLIYSQLFARLQNPTQHLMTFSKYSNSREQILPLSVLSAWPI